MGHKYLPGQLCQYPLEICLTLVVTKELIEYSLYAEMQPCSSMHPFLLEEFCFSSLLGELCMLWLSTL